MKLNELGWNAYFETQFNRLKSENMFPLRVFTAQREIYWACGEQGEFRAELAGKLRFNAASPGELPVVGDWVTARLSPGSDVALIESILPRFSKFSRKVAGKETDEQVLVSNIDIAFLINGLDGDYNLRRIERYLALIRNSNAMSVMVLNKTDLCPDFRAKIAEVEAVSRGDPVIAVSAVNGEGIEDLKKYITKGVTVAFLGSSGAGKSTIINRLLGEDRLATGAVRESDCRGMHITTRRELILLPGGGIVIDNPGLRELQLWAGEESLDSAFEDIKELSSKCRFRDCLHINEPACAVRAAIENSELDSRRFQNYLKMKKELSYLETRKEEKAKNVKIKFEKKIALLSKQIQKHRKNNYFK